MPIETDRQRQTDRYKVRRVVRGRQRHGRDIHTERESMFTVEDRAYCTQNIVCKSRMK